MALTTWDPDQQAVLALAPDATGTIIGAPGSGKTAVLVERVARLIDGADAPFAPGQVLVLTPSRASATRLRDRLGQRVRAATPGPLARSVGSFAFHVMRADAAARGSAGPTLLTGAEQDRILAHLIEGDIEDARIAWPDHLGPTVRRSREFRSELRAFLDTAVELDASRDELRAVRGGAWRPVVALLDEYAGVIQNMNDEARDAAELLQGATAALRDGAHIPGVDELRAVIVDDVQELTRGGTALVEALRARGVAVLAAGDPDIGSGAFRGITPEVFSELVASLGDVLVLRDQHRAGDEPTWLVRHMTAAIGVGGHVQHRRAPGPEPTEWHAVSVVRAPSPPEEVDQIARRLRDAYLNDGVRWGEMAVIAHDTRQLVALESELAARDVPTRAAGVPRPLGSERAVRQIMEILRLGLTDPAERDPDALVAALRSPYGGFDGVALRRLRGSLRHAELEQGGSRPARELVYEGFAHPVSFGTLGTPEGRAAERFATTMRDIPILRRDGATVHDLLWHVWDRARGINGRRLRDDWRDAATSTSRSSGDAARALDGLVALFAAAKRSIERSPHDRPERFIREILDSDVPEDTLSSPDLGETVALLTPANALSTEFEIVVIAGLQDGVWPNTRLRGGMLGTWRLADTVLAHRAGHTDETDPPVLDRRRQALHDEVRLFVRALSRARSRVIITAVDDDDATPSPLLGSLPDPEPIHDNGHPLTLRGLVARHRRTLTAPAAEEADRQHAAEQLRLLAVARVPGADPDEWYGLRAPTSTAPLRDLESEHVRVSPSKITSFLECGLEWVISALGGDTMTSPSAGIGTLLHAALERVPDGGIDEMRAVVDERWGELDFESRWVATGERRRLDEYLVRLDDYLANVRAQRGRVIAAEAAFAFAIDLGTGEIITGDDVRGPGRAVLSGVIDRVEAYPRGEGEHAPARSPKSFEVMRSRDDEAAERVVVTDLKSGRSEERVADAKVIDDAQLAAYQLAVEEGLVDAAEPGALAGARLVVVSKTLSRSTYRVAHQRVLDGDETGAPHLARDEYLERVIGAARGMSAASFSASVDAHCDDSRRSPICRIHTIGAVSA